VTNYIIYIIVNSDFLTSENFFVDKWENITFAADTKMSYNLVFCIPLGDALNL